MTTTAVFTAEEDGPPRLLPKAPLTPDSYREGLCTALTALRSEAATPA
jgi:hypothetical protein